MNALEYWKPCQQGMFKIQVCGNVPQQLHSLRFRPEMARITSSPCPQARHGACHLVPGHLHHVELLRTDSKPPVRKLWPSNQHSPSLDLPLIYLGDVALNSVHDTGMLITKGSEIGFRKKMGTVGGSSSLG